jgi:DNA-binding response OmpR family regulator
VTKPFHPRVLLARVKALLRRSEEPAGLPQPIEVGAIAIDVAAHEVRLDGRRIELTRTEFDLLALLAAHPDRVFSRASILDHVRDGETDATERAVDFQIASLRRKLGATGAHIETVRGVGYKLGTGA